MPMFIHFTSSHDMHFIISHHHKRKKGKYIIVMRVPLEARLSRFWPAHSWEASPVVWKDKTALCGLLCSSRCCPCLIGRTLSEDLQLPVCCRLLSPPIFNVTGELRTVVYSFHSWGHWGPERWSTLFKFAQQVNWQSLLYLSLVSETNQYVVLLNPPKFKSQETI